MSGSIAAARRSVVAVAVAVLLVVGVVAGLPKATARADTAPLDPANPTTPATVSADPLPTAQINGVAWAQVVVGDTVYVTGEFSRARPAGAAPGTREVVRNNLLAYDIRTGELDASFAPSLNAQGLAIAASPDGSRIYVGGDFTSADGQPRYGVAAYDTATGQLVAAFRPAVNSTVRAIAATESTVYLGGEFSSVGGTTRTRLAAVAAADGLLLPWAPRPGTGPTSGNRNGSTATSNSVLTLVVTGGGRQVVAGGRFYTMNGSVATGVSALDPVTGATRPFAVNQLITNQGVNSAVFSLVADGDMVYGTAYDYYGPGNIEGSFAVRADGGALKWANTCRGDTYSSFPMNGVLYHATHAHDCASLGSFPEQNPRMNRFATAVSLAVAGKTGPGNLGDGAFGNKPAPGVLPWWPNLYSGSYTGQYQAGWTVTGNDEFLVYGGEFPRVNGLQQQGLVRFTVRDRAPNSMGPRVDGTFAPTASLIPGAVRIAWRAAADQDNEYLTYRVYRDSDTAAPVCETTRGSQWWRLPTFACVDTTASAGSHRYRVMATDAFDNRLTSTGVTVTAGSAQHSATRMYAEMVSADGSLDHWPLGEVSGAEAFDWTSTEDLTAASGVSRGRAGAIAGDTDTAYGFSGTSSGYAAGRTAAVGPQVFSVEAWFQTTSRAGGKIVGYGNARTGLSTSHDRSVYMDTTGRVFFGVHNGAVRTVGTTTALNDGRWHHAVGTLDASGMSFYVDGVLVGRRDDVTRAAVYPGYWRVGGDTTWSGGAWFNGSIDEVAVYPVALTGAQAAAHVSAGRTGRAPNVAPTAEFTVVASNLTVSVDGSGSTDGDGRVTGYAWSFGDGATGSAATASHTYAAAGTYSVMLTVTDDDGSTATVTREVTVTGPYAGPGPGMVELAADAFGREITGAWGTADVGGAWTITGSSATPSVTGGSGRLDAAAGGTSAASLPVSVEDGWLQADLLLERAPTGGGTYVSLVDRDQGGATRYTAQLRFSATGSVTVSLTRILDGQETLLGSYRLTGNYVPGTVLQVRFDVSGSAPAALRAKAWASGTVEPDWQVSATDATSALQRAGATRLDLYNSAAATGVQTLRVDNVRVVTPDTGAAPTNTAPTAAFTSSVSGLGVSVDGSGSSDAEGPVASYAWDFGDGTTGTGATASHAYAAAGTYPVTLTVTDAAGVTGAVTHSVTVTAATPEVGALAADAFGRAVTGGWGNADVGGAWTVFGAAADAAVAEGSGRLRATAGAFRGAQLSISAQDVDLRADVLLERAPTGGGTYVYLVSRTDGPTRYALQLRFSATGSVTASLVSVVDEVDTVLASYRLSGTYTPGSVLTVRFRTAGMGTTSLRAKAWASGTAEPDWQVSATDATAALQRPGAVRINLYNSSSAAGGQSLRVDDLVGREPGATP